jgi:predicted RNase H-like HicB family nuclease
MRRSEDGAMPQYVALVHKDSDGCYGVSFPDLPGVFTGGDTFEEAMEEAADVLQFASEGWINPDGSTGFKPPSTIEQLRSNPEFLEAAREAVIAFVEFPADAPAAD